MIRYPLAHIGTRHRKGQENRGVPLVGMVTRFPPTESWSGSAAMELAERLRAGTSIRSSWFDS